MAKSTDPSKWEEAKKILKSNASYKPWEDFENEYTLSAMSSSGVSSAKKDYGPITISSTPRGFGYGKSLSNLAKPGQIIQGNSYTTITGNTYTKSSSLGGVVDAIRKKEEGTRKINGKLRKVVITIQGDPGDLLDLEAVGERDLAEYFIPQALNFPQKGKKPHINVEFKY